MHTSILLFGACALYFAEAIADDAGECGVVSRTEWSDVPCSGSAKRLPLPVDLVVIADTVTKRCFNRDECIDQIKLLQRYHMISLHYSDIGQSFLIGDNGEVYEGRGWRSAGVHATGDDNRSIAIAFIGNYMYENPPTKSITAVQDLLKCGIEKGYLSSHYQLAAHRDLKASLSPGDTLYKELKAWPHYNETTSRWA